MPQVLKQCVWALLVLASSAAAAVAAPTKLPTSFNPERHVYVTPGTTVNTAGLEQQLQAEAAQYNLSVYVVFTTQGDEPLVPNLGGKSKDELLKIWSVQQGFPGDNHMIVVIVQSKTNPADFSTGAAIGSRLRRLGINDGDLSQALQRAGGKLPGDPAGFAVETVRNINADIAATGSSTGTGNGGNLTTILIIGGVILVLVVGGIGIYIVMRKRAISRAKEETKKNLADILVLITQLDGAKSALTAAGLRFQPYQSRLDQALLQKKQAEDQLERDPEAAAKTSSQCKDALTALITDLKRAVELKTDTSAKTEIDGARRAIAEARQLEVVWNYPGMPGGPKAQFLLNESGFNPDDLVRQADSEMGSMYAALENGEIAAAERHWKAARSQAQGVAPSIAKTFAAKLRVENEMGAVLKDCTEVDRSSAETVKGSYLAQRFHAAVAQMTSLKQLIADRREARAIVGRGDNLRKSVAEVLRQNDRYVSYETNRKFDDLQRELARLQSEVKQPVTDWASLVGQARKMESDFQQVEQAAHAARQAYDNARQTITSLSATFERLRRNVSGDTLTRPTNQKLNGLSELLVRLNREIQESKRDWLKIKQEADDGSADVIALEQMLDEDKEKGKELAQQNSSFRHLNDVRVYEQRLRSRQYNGGVALAARHSDFLEARRQSEQRKYAAERFWDNREWVGLAQELKGWFAECSTMNLVGWWCVLQMMRDSDDYTAQHYAFQMGFRDNVTWQQWRDRFISKQHLPASGLWQPTPADKWLGGSGGADFTSAPDFKGYGGDDPWTPPTPTTPTAPSPAPGTPSDF